MPLYEYQCDSCEHRFEVIQKFSDPHISVCPNCGGPVQKLLSSPAIQFKGSGFYLTDYGRGGKSDTAPGTPGKTDGAPTGDAKPAASAEGAPSSKPGSTASKESKPAESKPAAPPAKSD